MDDQGQSKVSRGGRTVRMTTEDRKLRNRLSQKAFRARQAMRIKELEQRLESRPVSETERISQLEDRNAFLANKLFDCHKKLESLQVTIKALSDATAEALDMVVNKNKDKDANERGETDFPRPSSARSSSPEASEDEAVEAADELPSHSRTVNQRDVVTPSIPFPTSSSQAPNSQTAIDWTEVTTGYDEIPDDLQHALQAAISQDPGVFANLGMAESPNIDASFGNAGDSSVWDTLVPDPVMQQHLSFGFPQIGPHAYAPIERHGRVLIRGPHGQLHRTNSPWSDHITTVEYFLRRKLKNLLSLNKRGRRSSDSIASSTSFMLSSFICLSWPTMAAWHSYTRAHIPVGSVMAWRMNPTPETYAAVDPAFRPTRVQMAMSHPPIIDWVPYGTLRDKLIIYHAANPNLDELICEIGNAYVMETDLSSLIAGIPSTRGYVGVWDLVRSIAPEATSPSGANLFEPDFGNSPETIDDFDEEERNPSSCTLPAPDTSALFGSKSLALEAFKMIGMHKGPGNFLLDPQFFQRHPELYDPRNNIAASGVLLRPGDRKLITTPRPLDSGILGRYKELSSWSLSLSSAITAA